MDKQFKAEYMRTDDMREIEDDKDRRTTNAERFRMEKIIIYIWMSSFSFQFVHKRIGTPRMLTNILKYETHNDLTKLFRIDSGKPSDYGHSIELIF